MGNYGMDGNINQLSVTDSTFGCPFTVRPRIEVLMWQKLQATTKSYNAMLALKA